MTEVTKPPLSITVAREAGPFDIKMSYGLEMDLRRVLPDPSTAMQLIMVDPDTQDYVVRRCLTPSKKLVRDENELISPDEVDLDTNESDKILLWALEHQLYFFAKRAKEIMTLAARQQTKAPSLHTTDGSEVSPSKTPSAGPSESSKEISTTSSGNTLEES